METKQHATRRTVGWWWNQRRNKKILWKNRLKNKENTSRQTTKWKHSLTKSMGCSKSSSKKEVNSDTGLPQEKRKTQKNNLIYHLKWLKKKKKKQSPKSAEGRIS